MGEFLESEERKQRQSEKFDPNSLQERHEHTQMVGKKKRK